MCTPDPEEHASNVTSNPQSNVVELSNDEINRIAIDWMSKNCPDQILKRKGDIDKQ